MKIDGIDVDCNNAEVATVLLTRLLACLKPSTSEAGVKLADEVVDAVLVANAEKMTAETWLWVAVAKFADHFRQYVLTQLTSEAYVKGVYPQAVVSHQKVGYTKTDEYTVVDAATGMNLGPTTFTPEKSWDYALERIARKAVES